MPGQVIPILSKRPFDFVSGSGTSVLIKAVPCGSYTEGVLLVRVHSGTFGSGSSIALVAQTTAPSGEDPSIDFLANPPVATATVTTPTSAGQLVKATLASGFGAFLQIKVIGTLSGSPCNAVISAELSVKE